VPQDLRAYQGKDLKRALKQGSKRQDLGPPPRETAPQTWRSAVLAAAARPVPPQPVEIASFSADELGRTLVLSGTSRHREERVTAARRKTRQQRSPSFRERGGGYCTASCFPLFVFKIV
jgi:hypothetical protein